MSLNELHLFLRQSERINEGCSSPTQSKLFFSLFLSVLFHISHMQSQGIEALENHKKNFLASSIKGGVYNKFSQNTFFGSQIQIKMFLIENCLNFNMQLKFLNYLEQFLRYCIKRAGYLAKSRTFFTQKITFLAVFIDFYIYFYFNSYNVSSFRINILQQLLFDLFASFQLHFFYI